MSNEGKMGMPVSTRAKPWNNHKLKVEIIHQKEISENPVQNQFWSSNKISSANWQYSATDSSKLSIKSLAHDESSMRKDL
jgi:hypothetical protein